MTFLFEDIISGETIYIVANDLSDAIDTFEVSKDSSESGFDQLHVYVRLI